MSTDAKPRDDLAGRLKRTEIQHEPSSIPGREIVQTLTEIPAGVYTLYFVPSESGTSKLAFSKKLGGWGIPGDDGS